eukprot:1348600-Pleurochrysis_carterae.AAC.1
MCMGERVSLGIRVDLLRMRMRLYEQSSPIHLAACLSARLPAPFPPIFSSLSLGFILLHPSLTRSLS